MDCFLFLAFCSLILCLLLTPVCRDAFQHAGLVDHPDQFRKKHLRPVPRIGGVAIAIAYVGSYALLLISPLNEGLLLAQSLPLVWRLLPAAGLIFATGLIDDLAGLKPWQKLLGQIAAAVWACGAGVRILAIAGYQTHSWWSLPVTVVWLVGCTNAFNLIDGIDGLAAGVGFFATLTTLIAALLQGNTSLALATIPLAAALLGFLRYNFNPASIFLGDSGSLLVGFLLGCYGVLWSQKSATLLGMTAPLLALAIPILDVCLSIARRFIREQPIFSPDRGHIHHRLLDRGLTPRKVALLLYAVCGLAATFSLLLSVAAHEFSGIIIILFCAATWVGIQNLDYAEFGVARTVLLGGAIRRMLRAQLCVRGFEQAIAASTTPSECWAAVRDACDRLGFQHVRARIAGESFDQLFVETEPGPSWTIRVPLAGGDYVNCLRDIDCPIETTGLAAFADTLSRTLRAKVLLLRLGTTRHPELTALMESLASYGSAKVMSEPPAATATYCLPANE